MISPLFFYQLVLVALVWLCVMLHWAWPSDPATAQQPTPPQPAPPRRTRSHAPTPFAGLTTKSRSYAAAVERQPCRSRHARLTHPNVSAQRSFQ